MRLFHRTLVSTAIALALAGTASASSQFTNIYFFGDSYTDMGSYKPVLPPGTGMFTTNPGSGLGAAVRSVLRLLGRTGQSGWHRLCVRRGARDAVAGLPARPSDQWRGADRNADPAADRQRSARPECYLFRVGWRATISSPSTPIFNRARSRRPKFRPTWRSRQPNSRSRSGYCAPAVRNTSSSGTTRMSVSCRPMPGIRRSAR